MYNWILQYPSDWIKRKIVAVCGVVWEFEADLFGNPFRLIFMLVGIMKSFHGCIEVKWCSSSHFLFWEFQKKPDGSRKEVEDVRLESSQIGQYSLWAILHTTQSWISWNVGNDIVFIIAWNEPNKLWTSNIQPLLSESYPTCIYWNIWIDSYL